MVPILSGNLSVEYFRHVMAGRPAPAPGSHRADLEEMQALGATGVEDYVAWGAVERRRGDWDFSFHQANRRQCEQLGLDYLVYPWLHVVPDWYRDDPAYVPYRCLEHGAPCGWPSTFAPGTYDLVARFYEALARELGAPAAVCLAVPADYGEVGYPTGWARWVAPLPAPHDHAHPGFWAGDEVAQEVWRKLSRRPLQDPRTMPDPEARAEFAAFYLGAMNRFVDAALTRIRAALPGVPLVVKVGHGGESLCYGIDPAGIVQVCARHGASLRSTRATLPEFHQRRLATPARHFGVDLSTESPADVGRETTAGRLFTDASCGTRAWFDFPEHLRGAKDLLGRLRPVLRGDGPQTDVAVLFPSSDHRRRPDQGFPPVLYELGDLLRDCFDHELVDEELVLQGALAGHRVLLVLEGEHLPAPVQEAVREFVGDGGQVVLGPDVRLEGGWLGEARRAAPCAATHARLSGRARPSQRVDVGVPGDRLRLAGDWFPPEDACQFREGLPTGERCRWTGREARAFLPVDPAEDHLLEIECWVHPGAMDLPRRVRVNGVDLGPIQRWGIQRFAAWVPAAVLARAALVEVCLACETFRPSALDLGPDDRDLGVAVFWLRLTRQGHPAWADHADPEPLDGELLGERADPTVGAVWAVKSGPLSAFLCVARDVVERCSATAAALRDGGLGLTPPPGVRTSLFRDRLLLWNRRHEPAALAVGPREARRERVLAAGGLALLDRATGGDLL